jgi:hypothetical protein
MKSMAKWTAGAAALAATVWSASAAAQDTEVIVTTPESPASAPVIVNQAPPPAPVYVAPPPVVVREPASQRGDVVLDTDYSPNKGLLVTGAFIFGATYTASIIAAARSDRDANKKLYIPLVGPWMDLADRRDGRPDSDTETTEKAFLVADGILQGIGTLQIISAFAFPTRTVEVEAAGVKVSPTFGAVNGLSAKREF